MSTRANIIIKDKYRELYFYRHSDGYPEGTLPTLNKFLDLVITNKIRDNVSQAAGWLILIGADEYKKYESFAWSKEDELMVQGWKVGAYEPTSGIHGDIDYLYIVDLDEKEIKVIKQ